ncbi:Glutathione S-transferase kappa 1 [Lamellibrachia satsuma]|nr:Glutathione S-transferase kappa 1 [Lamellibrachia satsuma]
MASPVKKTVELFYDVVSPYSWIAFEVLLRYQTKWNLDLKLKPFFLSAIMNESGNHPPGMVPNKATYMVHDLARCRRHFQVPLRIPSNPMETVFSPRSTLTAMRLLTAVDMEQPQFIEKLSRQLWIQIWNKDRNLQETDVLAEAAARAGLSKTLIANMMSLCQDKAVKDRLRSFTQEALDHGAFGAPTIVAYDTCHKTHMVFGSDRFHFLADILGETYEGPLTELAEPDAFHSNM